MKTGLSIILLIFTLVSFSCKNDQIAENEQIRVKAAAAKIRELPDETSGFGNLSFISKVDITSPQEAVISRLFFREGDSVKQGEIVALLENPQINLAVERAENNYSQALAALNLSNSRLLEGIFQAEAQLLFLEKAEAELVLAKKRWEENFRKHQNQETLFEAGGIHTEAILVSRFTLDTEWDQILLMERELDIRRIGSRDEDLVKAGYAVPSDENGRRNALILLLTSSLRAETEAAQARLEAAEKELSSAKIALSELTIYSPASGIIGARYLEEGERVRPLDKIMSLIDTASLYAIFPVREKNALRIEKNAHASVLIDGTGEIYEGTVDLVYPQADSQTLSFLVRVLINGADRLKSGMFARITITLGPPREALFIPESSIFSKSNNPQAEGEGSVFIINGSVLSERKITFGAVYGEEREVTAGLKAGELIVLRPDSSLREGTNVTVIE